MLKVKIWCLPLVGEKKLNALHQAIIAAMTKIPEMGVKDENGMCNLFPRDLMKYGLGTEIPVEISGVDCSEAIRDKVSEEIGIIVKTMFPLANVDVDFIEHGSCSGHWSSTRGGC